MNKIPKFQVEEDKARAEIKAASERLGPITEDLEQINKLMAEAMQFSC